MSTALLLIAHGSRLPEANADLEYLAQCLGTAQVYAVVECCYLELAQPDIDAGGATCVGRGADRVLLFPYFLSAGVHVTRDLEEALIRLSWAFPGVDFRLCAPLGRHPLLLEIVLERAREAEHRT